MRLGFISTRFSGTDGVSLEVSKLDEILRGMNHETFFCAGELGPGFTNSYLVPLMSFNHPEIQKIQRAALSPKHMGNDYSIRQNIEKVEKELQREIQRFIENFGLDILISQNAQSLPMNIPLGVALGKFIKRNSFPTIAHHHDFWWERKRFQNSPIEEVLHEYFPPALPSSRDLVINSIARDELHQRKGIEAKVLPNVFNFSEPSPQIDEFNNDLRKKLGLREEEIFFLQPTRVVSRKGIEHSLKLLAQLPGRQQKLFITHEVGDEGMAYLQELRELVSRLGVDLRYVANMFGQTRMTDPRKRYSLWDAYLHADFVTYPSFKEGFGNALLETIYFKLPALVNRYPVYVKDIAPLGFEFVEMDGRVTAPVVEKVKKLLRDKVSRMEVAKRNFRLGRKYFSYQVAERVLAETMATLSS